MSRRPPKQSDGTPAVTASEDSGGDPPPVGATGAQTSRLNRDSTGGGEPDSPSWARTPTGFAAYQSRTIFRFPRRSSSGYFSDCDSLPSSPLSPKPMMADKAIQTPSLASQLLVHALQRMSEVRDDGPETNQQEDHPPSPSRTRQLNAAGDMQAEIFGLKLRQIGDDYNRLLLQRRAPRPVMLLPNILPRFHQEPITLVCVGLLLILIGRWMYLQGSTNNQDHAQV